MNSVQNIPRYFEYWLYGLNLIWQQVKENITVPAWTNNLLGGCSVGSVTSVIVFVYGVIFAYGHVILKHLSSYDHNLHILH